MSSLDTVEGLAQQIEDMDDGIKAAQRDAMNRLDSILKSITQEIQRKNLRKMKKEQLEAKANQSQATPQRRTLVNTPGQNMHFDNDFSPRMLSMYESSPFMHDYGKIGETEKGFSSAFTNNSQESQLAESEFENSHQPI